MEVHIARKENLCILGEGRQNYKLKPRDPWRIKGKEWGGRGGSKGGRGRTRRMRQLGELVKDWQTAS